MIKKDQLIQDIDRLIELKQRFTIMLDKCMAASFSFRAAQAEQKKIDHLFEEFVRMQKKHRGLLSEIKEGIKDGDQDVY